MTAVWAFCRNGDRHYGHLGAWGGGSAVIGGTRIEGVVFIDTDPNASGRSVDTARSRPGDRDARTSSVPAAGPTAGPVDAPSVTDGQGKSAGPALYGCLCGHSRHDHGPYLHCRRLGCLCDKYRSATTNADRSSQPAAS